VFEGHPAPAAEVQKLWRDTYAVSHNGGEFDIVSVSIVRIRRPPLIRLHISTPRCDPA